MPKSQIIKNLGFFQLFVRDGLIVLCYLCGCVPMGQRWGKFKSHIFVLWHVFEQGGGIGL